MPYSRRRFSRSDERAYARSNAITAIRVLPSAVLRTRVAAVAAALATEDRRRVELASQQVLDEFCQLLRVAPLRVEVCGKRPTNHYGELHGLYTPANGTATRDRVQVWMRTARRLQVVAFKTFLRTLLHELCHHLDYEYLKLECSFHTEGFYRRESSLVYTALPRTTERRVREPLAGGALRVARSIPGLEQSP
ncbi:MAG: hypothetical protein HY271_18760 [Deltaproteobacteria bacterium]|nr:hypothetical protein [Deltaproteobacteria bacterium]